MVEWSRLDPLEIARNTIARAVRTLDARVLEPARALFLLRVFAEVERLAAAGKAICAARIAESNEWRRGGDRSPADWLARTTGSSTGSARALLDVAGRLGAAPNTDAAFRAGKLTVPQAEAITAAAAVDPASESRLLAIAEHQSLQKLRDEAARVRAAADGARRHARVRRSRFWRRWTDADGARCGMYRTTPEQAAVIEAAAQPFIDAEIDRARRDGRDDHFEALAVDGLAAMAATIMTGTDTAADAGAPDGGGPRPSPPSPSRPPRGGRGRRRMRNRRELIGIVNLESLRRGTVAPGETCEIAGVGQVPVEVAREVFGDALLRIVIRDGVDIRTVVHTRHRASAVQETAVLVREGGICLRPTCGNPIAEIDHADDYSRTRRTTLDRLGGLCGTDHDLKTRHGHWYTSGPRGWEWHLPDGTVEYTRPPPDP